MGNLGQMACGHWYIVISGMSLSVSHALSHLSLIIICVKNGGLEELLLPVKCFTTSNGRYNIWNQF